MKIHSAEKMIVILRNIILFLIIILCVFLFACHERPEKTCFIVENIADYDNKIEFGYLDTNNVFYPRKPFILDSTTNNETIYPITLKMTYKKIKTEDKEMDDYVNKMYFDEYETNGLTFFRYTSSWICFLDKYCNELLNSMFNDVSSVSFYIKEETDSNYILTTQIASGGKYILGHQIFFVDPEYYNPYDHNLTKYEEERFDFLHKGAWKKIIPASKRFNCFRLGRSLFVPCGDVISYENGFTCVWDTIATIIN